MWITKITKSASLGALSLALFGSISCSSTESTGEGGGGAQSCEAQVICQGQVAVRCPDGALETRRDCSATGERCFTGVGCLSCSPGEQLCQGQDVMQCSADGATMSVLESCSEGCSRGRCVNLCEEAALTSSYFGCEYWPTPMLNIVSPRFTFGVAVANPQAIPAEISISRGGSPITARSVAPGAVELFELEWVEGLSQPTPDSPLASSITSHGAYRLSSSIPVTAYQFNPLEYELPVACPESEGYQEGDMVCNSFTNDASLLLPTHAMGQSYIVMSYGSVGTVNQARSVNTFPSSFQVVGVSPEPTQVNLEFTSYIAASQGPEITAFSPGETGSFTLDQGEVLQLMNQGMQSCSNQVQNSLSGGLHCGSDPLFDVSGTRVNSDKPVQVFGSHPCSFVPYRYYACDHLEESLFPVQSWGRSAIVSATRSLNGEPNLIRVFSSGDDNMISFTPEVSPAVTLNAGEWVEFETYESFRVSGTRGLQVLQLLVGQTYGDVIPPEDQAFGDPSMSLVPPEDQFRTDYTFLTPSTYALHYVSIVARVGQRVTLNGSPVEGLTQIPGTEWASVQVEIPAGSHSAQSAESFGVWVYGFGSFTSYFYPGGLDLRPINDVTY